MPRVRNPFCKLTPRQHEDLIDADVLKNAWRSNPDISISTYSRALSGKVKKVHTDVLAILERAGAHVPEGARK